MSRRESWCPVGEAVYIPWGARRPARLVTHVHRCPDGTPVVVTAQYVEMTGRTLYRWRVGGVRARPTSAGGDCRTVPPSWDVVDALHAAPAAAMVVIDDAVTVSSTVVRVG